MLVLRFCLSRREVGEGKMVGLKCFCVCDVPAGSQVCSLPMADLVLQFLERGYSCLVILFLLFIVE